MKLEKGVLVVNSSSCGGSPPRVVLVACKCKSGWCQKCCQSYGLGIRDRMRAALPAFNMVFVTLTIDQNERFVKHGLGKPQAAFLHVHRERKVARVMRALKKAGLASSRWMAVFEPHKSGWPHWHLVIDWTGAGDKNLLKDCIRAAWGLGFVDVNMGEKIRGDREHAINYLAKYLISPCAAPEWVAQAGFRVRRFTCSRGLLAKGKKKEKKRAGKNYRKSRPLGDRLKMCRGAFLVYAQIAVNEVGSALYRLLGVCVAPWEKVCSVLDRSGGVLHCSDDEARRVRLACEGS